MMKRLYIVAATFEIALTWAREHELPPRSYEIIRDTRHMQGIDGTLLLLPGWQMARASNEIIDVARTLRSKGRLILMEPMQ